MALRREVLFRLHLTPYKEAVLPACLAGRTDGMRKGIVMDCFIRNLSIPPRTALGDMGVAHPVDAVFKGPPDGAPK